jgi:hypothetical protein
MGWYADLGTGAQSVAYRVINDPTSFFGVVAFGAGANGDACNPSGSTAFTPSIRHRQVGALQDATGRVFGADSGVVTDLRFLSVDGRCAWSAAATRAA